ncbi:hypothetical protein IDJ77_11375 [Mucilaginibacter sp. ZT4R22]|uniref:XRE family transcriptional regulator n=2 Tax=Mucilaginibacter pankratovii TaxID=2772110 RepID=A0ABR7WQ19_9SPHI|nr:hypothetical protein [Mucilaginibacter pankratovii]
MNNKKYRINEMLDRLPIKKNKQALKILPNELGVSTATFNNYRAITVEDVQDIPHMAVVKLEQFFSLEPGQLQNITPDVRPIADRPDDDNQGDIAAEFNLSK